MQTEWNELTSSRHVEIHILQVRLPSPPPRQSNPNPLFIGEAFGFVFYMAPLDKNAGGIK